MEVYFQLRDIFAEAAHIMLLLLFAVFSLQLFAPDLLQKCADFALPLHNHCVETMPMSEHVGFYTSVLCGEQARQDADSRIFSDLGLIHLILLTAHHLQFLDWIFQLLETLWTQMTSLECPFGQKTVLRVILRIGVLGALVAIAGAPVYFLRAWANVVLREINSKFRLGWRPVQRVSLSGLMTLFLIRQEKDASSLAIGWSASLAFALASHFWQLSQVEALKRGESQSSHLSPKFFDFLKRQIAACSLLYLYLLPLFIARGWPTFWIILCNALLAPPLSLVLFPLSFMFRFMSLARAGVEHVVSSIFLPLNKLAAEIPQALDTPVTKGLLMSGWSRVEYVVGLSVISIIIENLLIRPAHDLPMTPARLVQLETP